MVSALDFTSEGRWSEAHSLPLCCFLRQQTVPQFVYLGSTFSHLQPIKRTHSIAGLKMTFIECSLSLALYMRPQINLTIYKENFFNPSTTVESQKVNPSILLTLMSANSVCTFRGWLPLSYMDRKLSLKQCQCLRALGRFHYSVLTHYFQKSTVIQMCSYPHLFMSVFLITDTINTQLS